jgi:hypothetical protein
MPVYNKQQVGMQHFISQNHTLPPGHLIDNQQQVANKYTTYILNVTPNFGVTTSRTIAIVRSSK